jgi:hypothetical protein
MLSSLHLHLAPAVANRLKVDELRFTMPVQGRGRRAGAARYDYSRD